jgi:hypothetical protein
MRATPALLLLLALPASLGLDQVCRLLAEAMSLN